MRKELLLFTAILMASTGLWATTVEYLYPVYNTTNDPASGIASWQTGSVDATEITNASDTLNAGWYVVPEGDVQTGSLVCQGAVHLILADGAKLTAEGKEIPRLEAGIQVSGEGNSLTIYGQAAQSGRLIASGGVGAAGIGGISEEDGGDGHDITINGGKVEAVGCASGIGGGKRGNGYNIIINGGEVIASGLFSGAGIGCGNEGVARTGEGIGIHHEDDFCDGYDIIINGGTVTATGGCGASGIGGGYVGYGHDITINGGRVIATVLPTYSETGYGAGIGGGWKGVGSNITFTNGFVTAIGGDGASGIGNGADAVGPKVISAVKRCYVRAGDSEGPTDEIAHEDDTDLASQLNGNRYVTVIYDLIDAYNNGYAAGNADGQQEGKTEALGTMGTEQEGPAIEVTDQDGKVLKLYNPKKVNFIKVTTNE